MRRAVTRMAIGGAVLAAGLLLLASAALVLGARRVDGVSMAPTFLDGQLLAANPFDHHPARFQVVVVRGGTGEEYVKRVVGLPGDRIQISRSPADGPPVIQVIPAGSVQPYRVRPPGAISWRTRIDCCAPDGRGSDRPASARVPPDGYFVLGDNPDESVDSRSLGFTAPGAVRAVVPGRLWPPAWPSDAGWRLDPVQTR